MARNFNNGGLTDAQINGAIWAYRYMTPEEQHELNVWVNNRGATPADNIDRSDWYRIAFVYNIDKRREVFVLINSLPDEVLDNNTMLQRYRDEVSDVNTLLSETDLDTMRREVIDLQNQLSVEAERRLEAENIREARRQEAPLDRELSFFRGMLNRLTGNPEQRTTDAREWEGENIIFDDDKTIINYSNWYETHSSVSESGDDKTMINEPEQHTTVEETHEQETRSTTELDEALASLRRIIDGLENSPESHTTVEETHEQEMNFLELTDRRTQTESSYPSSEDSYRSISSRNTRSNRNIYTIYTINQIPEYNLPEPAIMDEYKSTGEGRIVNSITEEEKFKITTELRKNDLINKNPELKDVLEEMDAEQVNNLWSHMNVERRKTI